MSVTIAAADVNKLRQMTGAGMMDCKKALTETNGDFEAAIDYLRKKGQKIANNRADRDAKEGVAIAIVNENATKGIAMHLSCETDFVAKNDDFVAFAKSIAEIAIKHLPKSAEELSALPLDGLSIAERITENVGKIGEKIEIAKYELLNANKVVAYIHAGNRVAVLVGLSNSTADDNIGKDLCMQIASMKPIAIDNADVPEEVVERERKIAIEFAMQQGKPEAVAAKIAESKLQSFFKESTLLNQEFVKDGSKTIRQHLQSIDKTLQITGFVRVVIG